VSRNQWLLLAVLVVTGLSFFFTSRGPMGTPSHAGCFSHRDCVKGELCTVRPKDDGFATAGQCADACTEDEQCLNGWRCLWMVASSEGILTPRGPGERKRVCVDPKRF
jgi:hypothetical protein